MNGQRELAGDNEKFISETNVIKDDGIAVLKYIKVIKDIA